jgi:antirestriction protein
MTNEIRIYVACLAAYNDGILHGAWIDACQDIGDIWRELKTMLKTSPIPEAEEWAIHDYEGFGNLVISEYASLTTLHEMAVFIEAHDDLGLLVLEYFSGDVEEAREAIEDRYMGAYRCLANYAEETFCGEIPESLQYYIDWDAMARDMEMSGDILTIEQDHETVHVFLRC